MTGETKSRQNMNNHKKYTLLADCFLEYNAPHDPIILPTTASKQAEEKERDLQSYLSHNEEGERRED